MPWPIFAGPPPEPHTGGLEQAPVEGVHGLQLHVSRHAATNTSTRSVSLPQ
jgi:hypothetical protein